MNIEQLLSEAKQKGFNIGVCAKVVNDEGKVLLLQRSKEDFCVGVWEMPGGGVENSEALLSALKRELREEAGIELKGGVMPVDYFDFYNVETGKTKKNFVISFL